MCRTPCARDRAVPAAGRSRRPARWSAPDSPRVRRQLAEQEAQQRRLARPVGADQSDAIAAHHSGREGSDDDVFAETRLARSSASNTSRPDVSARSTWSRAVPLRRPARGTLAPYRGSARARDLRCACVWLLMPCGPRFLDGQFLSNFSCWTASFASRLVFLAERRWGSFRRTTSSLATIEIRRRVLAKPRQERGSW